MFSNIFIYLFEKDLRTLITLELDLRMIPLVNVEVPFPKVGLFAAGFLTREQFLRHIRVLVRRVILYRCRGHSSSIDKLNWDERIFWASWSQKC